MGGHFLLREGWCLAAPRGPRGPNLLEQRHERPAFFRGRPSIGTCVTTSGLRTLRLVPSRRLESVPQGHPDRYVVLSCERDLKKCSCHQWRDWCTSKPLSLS